MEISKDSVESICGGIIKVTENARGLTRSSRLLLDAGFHSQAYFFAYTACEELGKLPILFGAATRLAIGRPVDSKKLWKRFRSHKSKAIQFHGIDFAIDRAMSVNGSVDQKKMAVAALLGMFMAEDGLLDRNASLYVDHDDAKFVAPSDSVTDQMARELLDVANKQLALAEKIFGQDTAAAAERVRTSTTARNYDRVTDPTEFTKLLALVEKMAADVDRSSSND